MESKGVGKSQLLWLLAGVLLGMILLGAAIGIIRQNRPAAIFISPAPPLPTPAPSVTPGNLTVFISGEVNDPGVKELAPGAIVKDVIGMAGGFSPNADQDVVNLARSLSDGLHIHVPAVAEVSDIPVFSADPDQSSSDNKLVNINTAGIDELDTLPGIGPVTARKIIEHREANGPFGSIEAIMEVGGIGPGKYEDIKALISVD